MEITALQLAQRFVGIKEIPGKDENDPFVMSMLRLDNDWPKNDETPWCSGFVNYIAWLLRLPRSKSLRARSWLNVGVGTMETLSPGFDVVILSRGQNPEPVNVINAPGHVGFYAGELTDHMPNNIPLLGGNQGDAVCVREYPRERVLGVRRLLL